MSAVDALPTLQIPSSSLMASERELTSHCAEGDGGEGDGGGGKGAELRGYPEEGVTVSSISQPKQPTSCVNNNGEHNWPTKDCPPSLPPINISPARYNSKRLLIPISEELDLETGDEMTFVTDHDDFRQGSSSNKPLGPQNYGTGLGDVGFDEDEGAYERLLDEGLAREGLYRGNYRNLVLLYTLVPLTTLLSFICLALLPTLVLKPKTPSLFPYPPYLPFPVLEALTATALWSLSYLLRDFLYATAFFIATFLPFSTVFSTILSATLQTTSNLFFRQLAIPILLIPYYYFSKHHLQGYPTWRDDAFRRVWWVALGWAAAEAVVGFKQGYESIALYKDVLVGVNPSTLGTTPKQMIQEILGKDALTSSPIQYTRSSRSLSIGSDDMCIEAPLPISNEHQPLLRTLTREDDELERLQAENEVERDLDQLIALKNREELEEVYGIPVIRIPVFISCLHRINSILSSLGICLLLTAAYMQTTFAILTPAPSPTPTTFIFEHPRTASTQQLVLTTLPIPIIYTFLAITHTPLILPRIGIHTFVYVELLISLGVFFGGLAMWDALS